MYAQAMGDDARRVGVNAHKTSADPCYSVIAQTQHYQPPRPFSATAMTRRAPRRSSSRMTDNPAVRKAMAISSPRVADSPTQTRPSWSAAADCPPAFWARFRASHASVSRSKVPSTRYRPSSDLDRGGAWPGRCADWACAAVRMAKTTRG